MWREFDLGQKISIVICFLMLAVLTVVAGFAISDAIERTVRENTVYVDAQVVSVGSKGIQLSYAGDFGETKTVRVRTTDDYNIGDVIRVGIWDGRVELLHNESEGL